jgi:hypothetical protein
MREKFFWLAAVIAAHPQHKVVGRTRLQKSVKLLQRLGAPLDYDYMIHFYGPYSEGVQSDIGLLENLGLVREQEQRAQDGSAYFVLQATDKAQPLAERDDVRAYEPAITAMSNADAVVLELAATYDAFREVGEDHEAALGRLKAKKASKCTDENVERALSLLKSLRLLTENL